MSVAATVVECLSGQWRQFQPLLLIVFIDRNFIIECSAEHSERQHRENEYCRVRAWIWSITSEFPESRRWEIFQLSSIRGRCEGNSQTSAPIMGWHQWHSSIGSSQHDIKAHWDSFVKGVCQYQTVFKIIYNFKHSEHGLLWTHWWNKLHLHV